MPANQVLFNVRLADPSVSVIEIQGDMNRSSEKQLMEAYERAQAPQVSVVLLNFEKLDFMNSGGIGLLITLLIRASRKGQRLAACGLSPHFRKIFVLTRMQDAIPVFPDAESAMASLRVVA